ncbi:MAG: O-antigen ligase family protein, partial [Gemmataceae bacterium]|nr:O-antigen ligase family protein [Gemmataceae bacterium]
MASPVPYVSSPSGEAAVARHSGRIALFALFLLAPWPLGCASPAAQLVLALVIVGIAGLGLGYWWLTRQEFRLQRDPLFWILAGLTGWTWFQTIPLPEKVVANLSPQAVEWHQSLRPAAAEILPDEAATPSVRSARLPLSVAPLESQRLGSQLAAVTLLYAAGRLVVGQGHSLRLFAWTASGLGLALALTGIIQYLTGERERIYGYFVTDNPSFGPFVNKNHFAFQMEVSLGLSLGLWLAEWRRGGWRSPTTIGVFFALGLMIAAVVLSQCRGGVLATVLATLLVFTLLSFQQVTYRRWVGSGLLLLGLMSAGWLLWLGNEPVYARLATLWHGEADNRTPLWHQIWRLVKIFPLTGCGGGAYTIAELATRPHTIGPIISTTAHNEYLEAWIEGGLPRLALTLLLVYFSLRAAFISYRRHTDPLDIGVFF